MDILTFLITTLNNDQELQHAITVGRSFPTNSDEQIVGYLHDLIEDNYCSLSQLINKFHLSESVTNALIAITRNTDEQYFDYIQRVKQNPIALKVKLADLSHNIKRCEISNNQSLLKRYIKAKKILEN